MTHYPIPARTIRIENVVVNSCFIATIGRADTVQEAKAFIQAIRNEIPDATHHVYAFKIGFPPSVSEGMSDDGEPSGTAGPPALAVLRGADLGDVALVITRYFGGTKLGTGGLSAVATGGAQGAVAYYSTYVVGRAAEHYLANGRSWGDAGPKLAVREILDSLDRDSILEQAKADLQARLRRSEAD